MKFSILMPVYNAEKGVSSSIESALNQSYGDFELLCCDDGSGDGTLNVLQQYAAADDRVKVLVNDENIGALRTRNRLIREFEGDYCVWLDADDELHPSFLQTAKELLDQEAWDVIHFNYVERYPDGRPDHDVFYNHGSYHGDHLINSFVKRGYFLFQLWSKVTRKEVMKKAVAPEIRPKITDDVYISMIIYHHAKSFLSYRAEAPMYVYNAESGWYGSMFKGMSLERYKLLCKERREMFQYNWDFLKKHGYDVPLAWLLDIFGIGWTFWAVTTLETVEDRQAALLEFQKYFGISLQPHPCNMSFYAPGCEPKKTSYSFVAPKIKM